MVERETITIEVLAPAVCSFDKIDKRGHMVIPYGTTLIEALKIIKLPLIWRRLSFVTVNNIKVDNKYVMQDGDVLSVFSPVMGG